MNWKNPINQTSPMGCKAQLPELEESHKLSPKGCTACYLVTSIFQISNTNTLETIYFACFHCIMKYRITGWRGVICLTVKNNLLYNRKLMELWLVQNAEIHIKFV